MAMIQIDMDSARKTDRGPEEAPNHHHNMWSIVTGFDTLDLP